MSGHSHTDGLGESPTVPVAPFTDHVAAVETTGLPGLPTWRTPPRNERMAAHKIECNACPVLCQISEGKVGACDRYANCGGALVRDRKSVV